MFLEIRIQPTLLASTRLEATGAKNQYFEQEWHLSVKRNQFSKSNKI